MDVLQYMSHVLKIFLISALKLSKSKVAMTELETRNQCYLSMGCCDRVAVWLLVTHKWRLEIQMHRQNAKRARDDELELVSLSLENEVSRPLPERDHCSCRMSSNLCGEHGRIGHS